MVELKAKETEQIKIMQQLINGKNNDLQKTQLEIQLMQQGFNNFYNGLLETYGLDKAKKYEFKDGELLEVKKDE